ncbi:MULTISPECIES: adenosylcobinamide-phosphate synthase CbiB [Sporosarcina]|uniref:adenosylcobinamide-phosphate synthase CbiB n=1 Tax=Sporosarcina TaxID=1569 RepID=UPI00058AD6BF|nr:MULTISPECIES: adenosylcobinamide-phosphate synthase CbiB [Sporosarcina]WJY26548.1 adenosylcobinamide-phosphate synthase CbiB [Sporosarcina sp. 0.2-SM1T-5]
MDTLIALHLLAVTIGFLLDRLLGDPPHWPHPVRWLGAWIAFLTKNLNRGGYRSAKGVLLLLLTVLPAILAAGVITAGGYWLHPAAGVIAESILIAVALAQKSLADAARGVAHPLAAGDVTEARRKLSWIVGRDTEMLDEPEITRGVVETVSENISDGVTAPLFFAFLGGAPGIWLYKAVNTLDSMVGYKDDRYLQFGTASARLDDILNFISARISGLVILLVSPNPSGIPLMDRLAGWRTDARKHPSPNSGYLEAATAWQLGVRLGGTNTYRGVPSHRPQFGPGLRRLSANDIDETIVQLTRTSWIIWLIGILIGGICYALA